MKNKEIRKMQFGGWSKRPFKEIRSKVNSFDDDGEKEIIRLKKKKKVKCRSKAHIYEKISRPLGVRDARWEYYQCSKCGDFKFRL